MTTELLRSVLVLLVGFVLRLALDAIGVEIDEAVFNALVVGIVAWIFAALGVGFARAKFPNRFK